MENINVFQVRNLNKNLKRPLCHSCKIRLTPYSITDDEWRNISTETRKILIALNLMRMRYFSENEHLIFLCLHCLNWDIKK